MVNDKLGKLLGAASELPLDSTTDWKILQCFLPLNWQEQSRNLGAIQRCKKFASPEVLLRTLLIHLASGCSLRETVVRAREAKLVDVSDVALLKRLRTSGQWLQWMAKEVMNTWTTKQPSAIHSPELKIRIIDGTMLAEPGATGTTWRIHYSIQLPELACDEVHITSPQQGESTKHFSFDAGELVIVDRCYARVGDVEHVANSGADILVRLNWRQLPLWVDDAIEQRFDLFDKLRSLGCSEAGDWPVKVQTNSGVISGRICAIRKNEQAAKLARSKAIQRATSKKQQIQEKTLESADYIFIFTTLDTNYSAYDVLELYRGRWQIELVFKRLKSLLALGHLKKYDPDTARAWIMGKLLVAFLIQAFTIAADSFSPWGYPLPKVKAPTLSLA